MTGKTFLININCSNILQSSDEALYAMFIDTSKMSIVYELVEWIRWMFSLENCIYLMHEKSVIHELEDIQLLSELKNFEIIPCAGDFCVHKNLYRILLEDLNLIVPWKNTKVHKYFLDKISQMSHRLTQESPKIQDDHSNARVQNLISFNTETDVKSQINLHSNNHQQKNTLHSNENHQNETGLAEHPVSNSAVSEESPSAETVSCNKKIMNGENSLLQLDNTLNLYNSSKNLESKNSEMKKAINADSEKSVSNTSPSKKESTKHHTKPKPVKPFSVGELLSFMRKDLEKKNMENNSQSSASISEERTPEAKVTDVENSFSVQQEFVAKKRQRVRKRKKSNRQTPECKEFASCGAEDREPFFPLRISRSNNYGSRPNHIRFDMDDECDNFNDANVMETESINASSGNEHEINNERIHETTTSFFQNNSKELGTLFNGVHQNDSQKSLLCSSEKNDQYKMGCLFAHNNESTGEEMVTDGPCDAVRQSSSSLENIQFGHSNLELNDLLSLREKYKKGIVIERF